LRIEVALQRLFSTFPNGLPGAGLLLLRAVSGVVIARHSTLEIITAHAPLTLLLHTFAIGAALLLLAGLWTPIAGLLILFIQLFVAFSGTNGIEVSLMLATLGAALALLGPGSYSVDARRYGRKRIRIPND
jgi:uncharacterized membrane protein YphA (DoxX/SURF4 family)